ncbi:hypothetical protein KSS87_000850 [Heliosperma pusillum]|nr:hypothetical protein KSS87_011080 [Heliosperma pusillum]KAH9623892.1 hypothetical protein KSS87_022888 [Heliosperma pusillum]KAH9624480.1 hypothetical protein KSS87_000850 [Heliosperma pusillum]
MQKAKIQIWLFEQKDLRIEGRIILIAHEALAKTPRRVVSIWTYGTSSKALYYAIFIFSATREDPSERRQHYPDDEHVRVNEPQGMDFNRSNSQCDVKFRAYCRGFV